MATKTPQSQSPSVSSADFLSLFLFLYPSPMSRSCFSPSLFLSGTSSCTGTHQPAISCICTRKRRRGREGLDSANHRPPGVQLQACLQRAHIVLCGSGW